MKRKTGKVLLFFVLVIGWVLPIGAQDIRGVWKIASYTRDGRPINLEAMMIISQHHYTRVSMEKDRQKFDFNFREVEKLTLEQRRLVADTFPRSNASAGTYRIEEGVFYFKSIAHHNPSAVGRESKRNIDWKGDRLRLYGPAGSGYLEEMWERVEKF